MSDRAADEAADDAYRECLRRAIDRTQDGLLNGTEVWEDHSTWAQAWSVPSQHYRVRALGWSTGYDLGVGLEAMLAYFRGLLAPDDQAKGPFHVWIVPDIATYQRLGNDHGAEHSSFYGSFVADPTNPDRPVIALTHVNDTLLRMQVTHSALLQFLDRAFPGQTPPTFVSLGLASYFSFYWDHAYGVAQLGELTREGGSFIPLSEFAVAPLSAYANRTDARFTELGMLFNYLLHHRPDTRTGEDAGDPAPFRDYLRTVLSGNDPSQHAIHTLFTDRLGELERDFRSFEFPLSTQAR